MKRREFIILSGIGATSASLLSACGHPEEKLIPALIPDDEYVPGIDYSTASTCGMCPAGCGIVVRTREHKANKIEGNPLHPVNRGALCARGQAGLEVLYNPDRIKGPMRRAGERGEGKWEEISWDEAIKTLADKLREIDANGKQAGKVVFVTSRLEGVTRLAANWLQTTTGASIVGVEEFNEHWPHLGCSGEDCRTAFPEFDIANASYLLSFGARFLENWRSPVKYSLAYSEFRRAFKKARGKFVQIEPRMSLTGANADEWLPAAPGTEGLVALAIAHAMVRNGFFKGVEAPDFLTESLDTFSPEATADRTGIPPERIIRIAAEFATAERPLAMGGGAALDMVPGRDGAALVNVLSGVGGESINSANAMAINYLNTLAGNFNKPGGVLAPRYDSYDLFADLRPEALLSRAYTFEEHHLASGANVLMVHNANPAFTRPEFVERIKALPFIASFSSFMDETTALADVILPDHSYLEGWDLHVEHDTRVEAVVTVSQPIVHSEQNTRQTADVLLAIAGELQGVEPSSAAKTQSLKIGSAEELVKHAASQLWKAGGSISGDDFDGFWEAFLQRGYWTGPLKGEVWPAKKLRSSVQLRSLTRSNPDDYPFVLLTFEHAALGAGEYSNLPALQELPDPMTSVIWGSWVEINPKTARSLGLADGDLVEVSTEHGAVRVPAVVYPAIRPDVIAMPFGQGHTGYGRYAANRGANPAVLNRTNQGSVRARITRVGGNAKLVRFGTDLQERMEQRR